MTFIANGQQENPFELKRRIPAKPLVVDTTHGDSLELSRDTFSVSNDSIVLDSLTSQSPSLDIFNMPPDSLVPDSLIPQIDTVPLDSVPFSADTISTAQDQIKSLPEEKKEKQAFSQGDGLVKRLEDFPISDQIEVENRNVLLGVSILALLLLASLLAVNRSLIRKAYRAIANDNYLRFLNREYKSMPWLYWLFYLHFFINAGFFTYLLLHYFRWYQGGSIVVLLFCILFVFGAYMLKHLTLNTLASTFPVEKETGLYGFVTLLVNILLGIALLPLNLLVAFGPAGVVPFAIWAGIGLIILLYLFRQLKGLFISGRLVRSYVFHFFLYLCSAEIAPLLIVGKLALGNFG
ncbi:MAG: DUF4271 domain-containing protein [Saprospiraceae bacterium]|nr:DUF4271 domain-containing protein [Saprospiraceae bacterium]